MHIQSTINRRKSKENNQTRESTTEMVARPSVTGNGSTTNRMSLVVKTIAELERLNEEQVRTI